MRSISGGGMTLATGDNAKIIIGLLLIIAGLWHLRDALRDGHIPYAWGADRKERPFLFWTSVASYVGVAAAGVDLMVSGLFHIRTVLG
jgi:hypothetical protein